ncbi:MAG TPA: hypothetical protein VJH03_17940 [Blastocatellia bacterium]|nr:hypothetical protein [Blastocatellia bacterium]
MPAGFDFYENDPSMTKVVFKGDLLLRKNFFGPGSKKFKKTIPFVGVPIGTFMGQDTGPTDTIVERLQSVNLPSVGSTATVPIQIVALSLRSANPITVVFPDETQLWDVTIVLPPTPQPDGMMTIRKTRTEGGTFSSTLPVQAHFIFTQVEGGGTRTLDPPVIELKQDDVLWVHNCPPDSLELPGFSENFCPGATETARVGSKMDSSRLDIGVRHSRAPEQGEVFPGEASIDRVSFLFPSATVMDSDWGRFTADSQRVLAPLGATEGYLNVFTDRGWVVQNLFVAAGDGGIATYFDLGPFNSGPLNARAMVSTSPQTTFGDGTRNTYPVGAAFWNAEGAGQRSTSAVGSPPPANLITFIATGGNSRTTQPNAVNVQTAKDQCFPMSIANSLQYLENRFGTNIPNDHKPGLKGDDTLVGQLDSEAGRDAPARDKGSGVWFSPMLKGKFSYLDKKGLKNALEHKHQGRGYGNPPDEALPAGNFTSSGITSRDDGAAVTWAWICDEIKKGQDVELVFSFDDANGNPTGGHAVRVFECGTTLGIPWIGYLHDKLQTHKDANDSKGLETVRAFTVDLDGDGMINLGTRSREVRFALSESPRDIEVDRFPSSVALVTVQMPQPVQLQLSGPTTVFVSIAQDGTGAADTDGDGLDQVQTEMVELSLAGMTPLGPVTVRLRDPSKHPNQRTMGEIEERANTQAGRLDLPPFALAGVADSFFDVFFEVELGTPTGAVVLHSHDPKRMRSTITHKPPAEGETYFNPDVIQLFTENEQPAGVAISGASHTPNPRPAITPIPAGTDIFPSTMVIDLREDFIPGSPTEMIQLSSAGLPDGVVQRQPQAGNTIDTEMLSLQLQGMSPNLGPIRFTAGRNLGQPPSLGQYTNVTQRPDGTFQSADSSFDITYRIDFLDVPRIGPMSATGSTHVMATGIRTLPPNMNPADPCVMYMGTGGELLPVTTQILGFVNQMTWTPFGGMPGTACSGIGMSPTRTNRDVALTTSRRRDRRR